MAGPLRKQGAFFLSSRPTDHGKGMTEASSQNRIVASTFSPAWWLKNRHAQTIYPTLAWPGAPRVALRSELLELPDGDATSVDWLITAGKPGPEDPLLVILHGLEGSSDSTCIRHLLGASLEHGWQAAVLHFRDCGDYRNRLPRRYHAGETSDLRYFLGKLRTDGHSGPIIAAGYSLGGNVLLKYLGEEGVATPMHAAAAICVPLNLHTCAEALKHGFSKVYQRYLLKRMKKAVVDKFSPHTAAFDWDKAMRANTFAEFDDVVTAPLHGFADKNEYYDRCSSIGFLGGIERSTLIINALDDPFMRPEIIPDATALSQHVQLEVSKTGGHVGFVSGGSPWRPRYYLPGRIIQFLDAQISGEALEVHALPGM